MKINREDFAILFFITIIGLSVRMNAALSSVFPLNDGGLFYKMILDIQGNHFVLPVTTSYNNANLPFAYPPLAFYLYALISEISHAPVIKLMQFLPAIISGLTIPSFFLLAKEVLDTKQQALFSTLTFAFIPRAFEWLIMGGGVTRSLGFLLAIIAIRQYILLLLSPSTRNLFLAMLFIGLVVLTHPEAAVHVLISVALIYFWKSRTVEGLKQIIVTCIGALLIGVPWWLTIITRHGLDPFIAALTSSNQDSYNVIARILILFRFNFTDEPYLTLVSVIGLIGMFAMLAKQNNALPIWFCLTQLIEPRGGTLYMMIPLSMFAGFALDQVILPPLTKDNLASIVTPFKLNVRNGFIVFFFLYGALSASIVSNKITQQLTLTAPDLKALIWVKENTPPDSKFIVITQGNPLNDATSEWFPALTDRTSIATVFGYEWLNDGNFNTRVEAYQKLQRCAEQNTTTCLNQWAKDTEAFTYVYLRKTQETTISQTALNANLRSSAEYNVVYDMENIVIFLKQ